MAERDPAAKRFWLIQLSRLVGAIMAVVGLLILGETIAAPAILGGVLVALGMVDFFLVPTFLARRWSTRAK